MAIEGMEGDYEPPEGDDNQALREVFDELLAPFRDALRRAYDRGFNDKAARIVGERNADLWARTRDSGPNEHERIVKWAAAHDASPFLRQHSAISKQVKLCLDGSRGSPVYNALVRFLAHTLDMELPDQWRESQD